MPATAIGDGHTLALAEASAVGDRHILALVVFAGICRAGVFVIARVF